MSSSPRDQHIPIQQELDQVSRQLVRLFGILGLNSGEVRQQLCAADDIYREWDAQLVIGRLKIRPDARGVRMLSACLKKVEDWKEVLAKNQSDGIPAMCHHFEGHVHAMDREDDVTAATIDALKTTMERLLPAMKNEIRWNLDKRGR